MRFGSTFGQLQGAINNVLFTFTTFKASLFVNATNKPLVGGKLYTYLAETTTPATTYSNDTGTPNTNPIILDANGECNLYLDDDKVYRLILKDANDVTFFDKDRVSSIGGGDYKVLTFNTIADLRLKLVAKKSQSAQTDIMRLEMAAVILLLGRNKQRDR